MIKFSKQEIVQLFNSLLFITLIFVLASKNYTFPNVIYFFIINFILLFFSFVLHELAHKIVAQKMGFYAEYFSSNKFSLISILFAFFGFILIAPGAVRIKGYIQKKELALIALAGPLVNIILAIISYLYFDVMFLGFYVFKITFYINNILAIFNLIPTNPFDGKKIYDYNKKLYLMLIIPVIIIYFL